MRRKLLVLSKTLLIRRLVGKMDEEKHVRSDYMDWVEKETAADAAAAAAEAPPPPTKTESRDSDVRFRVCSLHVQF